MDRPTLREPSGKLSLGQRLRRKLTPTKLWNTPLENLFYYADSWLRRGTADFFSVVEVETTTACNRRCSYCPNATFERGLLKHERRMSDALFERLLEQLADLNFAGRISPHFYGEPLLDERLEDLIRLCRSRLPLAKVVIFSNGDYLTLERYLSLVRAGVDGFLVTQHSKQELKGVSAVMQYRKLHGSQGVRFDFRAFNDESALSNRGGLVEHARLETKSTCSMPAENVTIDHAGNVVLCCNDYFSSVSFGNIGREHLGQIWQKKHYRELRQNLKRGQFELSICQLCAAGENVSNLSTTSSPGPSRAKRPLPLMTQ